MPQDDGHLAAIALAHALGGHLFVIAQLDVVVPRFPALGGEAG